MIATTGRVRIPAVVPVLAVSIFALGTSEFMIVGLLPDMSADLGVSIPQAGYLISVFAIGMIVGAPLMTVFTLRLPRRVTLVAALLVFIAGSVAAALSTDYALLVVARLVTAVATATCWVMSTVVSISVVEQGDRARALSVLLAGLTLSNVAGIPAGTLIGQQLGWRAAFWAVAVVAAAGLVGALLMVRGGAGGTSSGGLAAEFAVFRQGRLWLALATIGLYQAAAVGALAYVSPLLTDVAGIGSGWVPLVLLGNGLGGLVGVTISGRFTDAHPWTTLFVALGAVVVVLALLGLLAAWPIPAVALVVLHGGAAFLVSAPLNLRVFVLAGAAPTLASATTTSAFNVGNSVGPWLGGLAISAGWGYTAPAWLGVGLACAAVLTGLTSWLWDARTAHGPPSGRSTSPTAPLTGRASAPRVADPATSDRTPDGPTYDRP